MRADDGNGRSKGGDAGPPRATPPAADADALGAMMSAGELPAAPPPAAGADAPPAVQPSGSGGGAAAHAAPAARPGREWLWRGLLALDLAALVAVLAWRAPERAGEAPPPGRPGFAVAEQGPYLRALAAAGAGRFDEAIEHLAAHLRAHPDLAQVERHLTYRTLAMFAVRAGRDADARRYEAAMEHAAGDAVLGALVEAARQAEAAGELDRARALYARLLAEQADLPPSARARLAEAQLKLGIDAPLPEQRGKPAPGTAPESRRGGGR